jgi:hypothetical protein
VQHLEERKLRLVDKTSDPPMRASQGFAQHQASLIPGAVNYLPMGAGAIFEPAVQINPTAISEVRQSIVEHEERIKRAFYVDLWLALLNDPRAQRPTATEVEATRQEVMLQLGPLLENLNNGLLDPAITRVYAILQRAGKLPQAPEELMGQEVRIEYISVLHQAQKLTSITSIRELISQTGALAQVGKVEAIDKVNSDAIMDELADILGVRPELVFSDDQVEAIRSAKLEQQQQQQQSQQMLAATQGVKNLSSAEPQRLADLASMVSPAAAAQSGMR